ncbi:hypothetical protein EOE18_13875 [Novosphingobium umbonatum]|uniref:Phage capsid protein n=1 Tax=Novosphingobium umbonatum TaxID=1908524 RepID=A0A437N1Z3_9SPHN|nr:GPO family capsid scaffolding protein [Novosphingobium umbonatum]RVU03939.1 hypothetical protein EOE18_13875 [Novosphingobium umbonatum]
MPLTKPFIVATAGQTVDGRQITEKELREAATSYNPETYAASVNLEHMQGYDPAGPFRAYGVVAEVTMGETEVDLNGRKEKRAAMFAVADLTEEAKALIESGQKRYPSVELWPNFGGKNFTYLTGLGMTDKPAVIGTQPAKFNRQMPGVLKLESDQPVTVELVPGDDDAGGKSFLKSFGAMLDGFAAKFAPQSQAVTTDPVTPPAPATPPATTPAPASVDFTAMRDVLEGLGKTFSKALDASDKKTADLFADLSAKVAKLEEDAQQHPAHFHTRRPPADGGNNNSTGYAF